MPHQPHLRRPALCVAALIIAFFVLCAGRTPLKAALGNAMFGAQYPVPEMGVDEPAQVQLRRGDYLFFGQYAGEPILWRVLAMEDGRPLLLAEHILCFKAFAACDDPAAGSSAWEDSALRQWLNSTRAAVPWRGSAPEKSRVWEGRNPYAHEPGFLHSENFPPKLRALLDTSQGDAVFLPTRTQLKVLSAPERRRAPTAAAVSRENSPYLFLRGSGWYWTRDAIATNACSVASVTGKGTFYKSIATDGMNGVCPALRLRKAAILCFGGDGSAVRPYVIMEEA